MFVDRTYGSAIASVQENLTNDYTREERFYGVGEINCRYQEAGKDPTYILERTGLAMINYNYDNLAYNKKELITPEKQGDPDYYIPMYYAAP